MPDTATSERTVHHRDWQDGERPLISSVRIVPNFKHARLRIWNRGGCAGEIVVNAEDADAIVDRLLPPASRAVGAEGGPHA